MIRISVVMPVWNGAKHVRETIESILNQTFSDFELLVIDDGSSDETLPILHSYKDSRLRIFERQHDGIVSALNYGVAQARSDWIARMDADDIAFSHRLARQWEALEKNSEAVLCYSNVELFGESAHLVGTSHLPKTRALLAMKLCFQSPIVHPSVIFRKQAFDRAGGYVQEERHAEDFGLWGRLIEVGDFVAISEPLLRFRVHQQSISKQKLNEQRAVAEKIAIIHCQRFMKLDERTAVRALNILRKKRDRAEWFWFLRHCAPRLRWKSLELFAWLAKQTFDCFR